ncbi:hypothetical protein Nepgr_023783 [Nepenthes gracilis]|uniref:Uncharacterized protein n=1 Tax=Nepenthes gracilis TaxID=150966 RepID=A0AAD3T340_NEPGR|nr:hypothetical protein Nepgr_023783 [Nepenthes gracilis]
MTGRHLVAPSSPLTTPSHPPRFCPLNMLIESSAEFGAISSYFVGYSDISKVACSRGSTRGAVVNLRPSQNLEQNDKNSVTLAPAIRWCADSVKHQQPDSSVGYMILFHRLQKQKLTIVYTGFAGIDRHAAVVLLEELCRGSTRGAVVNLRPSQNLEQNDMNSVTLAPAIRWCADSVKHQQPDSSVGYMILLHRLQKQKLTIVYTGFAGIDRHAAVVLLEELW